MKTQIYALLITLSISIPTAFRFSQRSGLVIRKGSFWVGCHYSEYNKRFCINILPCVTLWFVKLGGVAPENYYN